MKRENLIQQKSYAFAISIIKLYQDICNNKKEFIITKQILRSGTSIGANIEEAIGGSSRRDFAAKLNIAYKEARETKYWLRLLHDTKYLDHVSYSVLYQECLEITKILSSILITLKNKS